MKLTTNIQFWEGYLPTPRSRKERFRTVNETIQVEIPEYSNKDMCPAFFIHSRISDEPDQTIYLCDGKLYVEDTASSFTLKPGNKAALEALITNVENRTFNADKTGKSTAISEAQDYVSKFVVADGKLYRKTGEPVYTINTYGLGRNHGGTSLSVTTFGYDRYSSSAVYSALDAELAVKEAKEVALGRGDTDFVQYITADIDVLLPEACKFPRRIVDPLGVMLAEYGQGKPVMIFNRNHRFRAALVAASSLDGTPTVLVTLNCGLRMHLPLKADGRNTRNWFINRSSEGVLQAEITWEFLSYEYLDMPNTDKPNFYVINQRNDE